MIWFWIVGILLLSGLAFYFSSKAASEAKSALEQRRWAVFEGFAERFGWTEAPQLDDRARAMVEASPLGRLSQVRLGPTFGNSRLVTFDLFVTVRLGIDSIPYRGTALYLPIGSTEPLEARRLPFRRAFGEYLIREPAVSALAPEWDARGTLAPDWESWLMDGEADYVLSTLEGTLVVGFPMREGEGFLGLLEVADHWNRGLGEPPIM